MSNKTSLLRLQWAQTSVCIWPVLKNHYFLISVVDTVKVIEWEIIKTFTESSLRIEDHLVNQLVFHFLFLQKLARGKNIFPIMGFAKGELLAYEPYFGSLCVGLGPKSEEFLAGVQILLTFACLFIHEMHCLDLVRRCFHSFCELWRFRVIKSLWFALLTIVMLVGQIFVFLIVIF